MKKCSPSLAIKEMKIKTTLTFHLTPVRIATIRNTTTNRFWLLAVSVLHHSGNCPVSFQMLEF
jgi:hypothetical protein